MINIAKYEFNSKEQAEAKFEALHTEDGDGNLIPDFKFTVIQIGHLKVEDEVLDEDGEIVTPAVMGTKWHVDALWHDLEDHPYGWKTYSIDIDSEGLHGFLGINYLDHKF
tara:strand:+ start:118 stop:447 length:330 start_codon:yes stop_codon:yes gene_type:complete